MHISEFRQKYPEYKDVGDKLLMDKVNTRYPGTISLRTHPALVKGEPRPTQVGRFDPRRVMKEYAYHVPLTPSDIGRAGAERYFKMEMPESDAREMVNVALPSNKIVKGIRGKYPEYSDLDDIGLMEKVVEKYPQYSDVLKERRSERERLYKKIDIIEFKKLHGGSLNADEAFINLMAIPESGKEKGQQGIIGYLDMASFGFAENLLNHVGYRSAPPVTGGEKVMRGAGSLTGFIQSPLNVGGKIARNIPGLACVFQPINASSKMQRVLYPLLRTGFTLGAAQATLVPEDAYKKGLVQPGQRFEQFGSGFVAGTALGTLSFIPSRAARMISTSLFLGLPSTLREDSLEEQVFNYGLGAYMGIKGVEETIKNEGELRRLIDRGVQNPKGQTNLLGSGDKLLKEFETLARAEGDPYTDILKVGRGHFAFVRAYESKGWRAKKVIDVKKKLRQIKSSKGFKLRNDKISRIFEGLKGKNVQNLSNEELYNLGEHIRPENIPPAPMDIFKDRPPARPGWKGKHLSVFHHLFRLGYSSMEHMGFGGMFEEGMTGNVFRSDVKANKMLLLHRQMTNVWKRTVGVNKHTAKRIALARDGKLDLKKLAERHPEYATEYKVSQQVERYWKTWLTVQNRHRAKYGMKPIKPIDNYYTHVFDALRTEAQIKKYPYPDTLVDMQEYIIPGKKRQPFLKTRRGAKGYKMNIWGALDSYAYWGTNYIADDGLRQARRVSSFLGREMRINEREGKISPIDLLGIKKNIDGWSRRYSGQPGRIDKFLKDTMNYLPPSWKNKVGSLENLTGMWRTLLYTGAMGWRPKLALRNLGQHSLILGMESPRFLWRAITTRKSPQAQALLKESDVLVTRELGFAPELPYSTGVEGMERARRSAFHMFRSADRINVEDAFLAGYYGARSRGDTHKKAVKRGDHVAATTQYMYTKGNRGPISDLWGLSSVGGKMASMFTTWPINKIEYDLMLAKPENRAGLARYLAVVGLGALVGVASGGKIRSTAYTGWGAEAGLARKVSEGLIDFEHMFKPDLVLRKDIQKGLKDDELWKVILYDVNENTPLWEKF